MFNKKSEMLVTISVAPEEKKEQNIEFGFEHELKQAENNNINNDLNNINSAILKTYKNKVFKLNPYKDLDPISIESSNIQFDQTNDFLSGELKAKVLSETLIDSSSIIKTPLVGDIIIDYEVDKVGCQKRYDTINELLKNENNIQITDNIVDNYQELETITDEVNINELEDDKKIAEDIAEVRKELDDKVTDFDQVQTYISNDIEYAPRVEDKISEKIDIADDDKVEKIVKGYFDFKFAETETEDVVDIRFKLEKTSVDFYIFNKFSQKPTVVEEPPKLQELIEETVPNIDDFMPYSNTEAVEQSDIEETHEEDFIDIETTIQAISTKFYEEQRIREETKLKREQQELIENQVIADILNTFEESAKIEEAKRQAAECDLRIPSDVYILEVQNFIPLPEEPTAEIKAQMEKNLNDVNKHLDELPIIIFRDENEEVIEDSKEIAKAYDKILEEPEQPEYYIAPIQDFDIDETIGRVEETKEISNNNVTYAREKFYETPKIGDVSYEELEEAFNNIKIFNDSVKEVENEAEDIGLNQRFDSSISLAKAAKVEALVEKKKAERKLVLAEERIQAELEKQRLDEKIRIIQDKINQVKMMRFEDLEIDGIEDNSQTDKVEQEDCSDIPDQTQDSSVTDIKTVETPPRRRGRPAGSKNKKTLLKEARERRKLEKLGLTEMPVVPKKRGRPLGSKNKKRKTK